MSQQKIQTVYQIQSQFETKADVSLSKSLAQIKTYLQTEQCHASYLTVQRRYVTGQGIESTRGCRRGAGLRREIIMLTREKTGMHGMVWQFVRSLRRLKNTSRA
jgi:hypothetical protein